jgi:site-specific DNA-methyltransferase (adenine-specific)
MVVAKKLGRHYISYELSENYVQRIRQRLKQVQVGDPLEGAAEPLVSAPKTADGRHVDSVHSPEKKRRKKAVSKNSRQKNLPGLES